MGKLKVPTDADGLRELLSDPARLKAHFSPEAVADGTTKDFLDAYATIYAKRNPDTVTDVRDQVQSVLFDMIRADGNGKRPGLDLANAVSFRGGRPQVALSADGSPAVSKGRGAVYNKSAPGAQFEAAYREDDRFRQHR